MSKKPSKKKKVVATTSNKPTEKRKIAATLSKSKAANTSYAKKEELLFGKENYILMGLGAALITLGMLLMSGGAMPDPNTWDPDLIYSFRRTVLAPIVILVGIGVEIYAIFK